MIRDTLDWRRDGASWPNREASHFISVEGCRWHVQILGSGPPLLLVHGTGASSHSWRDVGPDLARDFTVIVPDLPGHGFTRAPSADHFSLPGMARALGRLLVKLAAKPATVVGHSAGAAIACRMDIDGILVPRRILSLNGALLPLPGIAGPVFPPLARALTLNPFVPWLVAWRARNVRTIEGLLRDMGSALDEEGVRLYAMLAGSPGHARAALRMMANWDLVELEQDLPQLTAQLTLVVGGRDRFITPDTADRVADRVAGAERISIPDAGHLAHEEHPKRFVELIRERALA